MPEKCLSNGSGLQAANLGLKLQGSLPFLSAAGRYCQDSMAQRLMGSGIVKGRLYSLYSHLFFRMDSRLS